MRDPTQIGIPLQKKIRWTLRRWSMGHYWYRFRLRIRRRRWKALRQDLSSRYVKSPQAKLTDGTAVVFADLSGDNGLSRGALYDLAQIKKRHTSVLEVDISGAISDKKRTHPPLTDRAENVYFFCQPDVYEHVFPLMTVEALKGAYRIGRWVWETPQFPSGWHFAGQLIHEVWAASEFSAEVFRRGLNIPVRVEHHAVKSPPPSSVNMLEKLKLGRNVFLGLAVMDIRSCPERKNPWGHVLAWQTAFAGNQNAVLVLKIRTSKRTKVVNEELVDLIQSHKNIILLDDNLPEKELDALRWACNVFLSLHRSEGYGLNIHEALLCGKPVVATHWSANTEYGPSFSQYYPVRSRLTKYRDWTNHYEDSGFDWADPNISHAAELLRSIFERWQSRQRSVAALTI